MGGATLSGFLETVDDARPAHSRVTYLDVSCLQRAVGPATARRLGVGNKAWREKRCRGYESVYGQECRVDESILNP